MKHKWVTLVTMQPEIYYQNSQSFYPSELFTLDHITMRHPVIVHAEQFLTKRWLYIGRGNALECAQENKFSPYRVAIY